MGIGFWRGMIYRYSEDSNDSRHITYHANTNDANGSSSRISELNEKRWLHLKQKFRFISTQQWSQWNDKLMKNNKSLIFSCQWSCGGLGDRLRGIVSTYFLALVLGRRFMMEITNPCNMTKFLQPNHYNWLIRTSTTSVKRSTLKVPGVDRTELIKTFQDTPFYKNWSHSDDVEFSPNIDYVTPLFSNPWLNKSDILRTILKEMSLKEANLNTLFSLLYETLFQPTEEMTKIIGELFKTLGPRKNHLVCLYIRVGKNPSNPNDGMMADEKHITETMIRFVDHSGVLRDKNPVVMIASDSSEVVLNILERFPLRSLTSAGPILHIDR